MNKSFRCFLALTQLVASITTSAVTLTEWKDNHKEEFEEMLNDGMLELDQQGITGEFPRELKQFASNDDDVSLTKDDLQFEIQNSTPVVSEMSIEEIIALFPDEVLELFPMSIDPIDDSPSHSSRLPIDYIGLCHNQLHGPLPTWLKKFSHLSHLYVTNCQLTGTIPTELGELSQLEFLRLSNNQLTGQIPASLGNLPKLQELYLDGNNLTGTVPEEFCQLSQLAEFGLWDTQLTGSLPIVPYTFVSISDGMGATDNTCILNIKAFARKPLYEGQKAPALKIWDDNHQEMSVTDIDFSDPIDTVFGQFDLTMTEDAFLNLDEEALFYLALAVHEKNSFIRFTLNNDLNQPLNIVVTFAHQNVTYTDNSPVTFNAQKLLDSITILRNNLEMVCKRMLKPARERSERGDANVPSAKKARLDS